MISNKEFEVAEALTNLCKKDEEQSEAYSSSLSGKESKKREGCDPATRLKKGVNGLSHRDSHDSFCRAIPKARNRQSLRVTESDKDFKRAKFAMRLMQVLQNKEYNNILIWTEKARTFLIEDRDEFVRTVLYSHFKGLTYKSFIRKLYRMGFKKIPSGRNQDAFYNKTFKRRYYCHYKSLARKTSKSQFKSQNNGVYDIIPPITNINLPMITPIKYLETDPVECSSRLSLYDNTRPISSRNLWSAMMNSNNSCLVDATLSSSAILNTHSSFLDATLPSSHSKIIQNALDVFENEKIQNELLHLKKIRNELLLLENKEQELLYSKEKEYLEEQKIKVYSDLQSARKILEAKELL